MAYQHILLCRMVVHNQELGKNKVLKTLGRLGKILKKC